MEATPPIRLQRTDTGRTYVQAGRTFSAVRRHFGGGWRVTDSADPQFAPVVSTLDGVKRVIRSQLAS